MTLPVFTQIVFDDVLSERDYQQLYLLMGAMLVVLVAMVGATLVQRYLLARAAVKIDGQTLDFLTGRLLVLPMSYFTHGGRETSSGASQACAKCGR